VRRLSVSQVRQCPPALEVSKEELAAWLLGPSAQKLTPIDGGAELTLRQRMERNEFGTFHSAAAGLVVVLVPRGVSGRLNDHVEDLRRFVVDSDAFLGAIKLGSRHVALVGRAIDKSSMAGNERIGENATQKRASFLSDPGAYVSGVASRTFSAG
jgi:hypothetical protein